MSMMTRPAFPGSFSAPQARMKRPCGLYRRISEEAARIAPVRHVSSPVSRHAVTQEGAEEESEVVASVPVHHERGIRQRHAVRACAQPPVGRGRGTRAPQANRWNGWSWSSASGKPEDQGYSVTFATLLPASEGPPVSLMTWLIVPVPPSETVTMSWNFTSGVWGTSKACSAVTDLLVLKKQ